MDRFQILKGEELSPETLPSTTNYVFIDVQTVSVEIEGLFHIGILRDLQVSSDGWSKEFPMLLKKSNVTKTVSLLLPSLDALSPARRSIGKRVKIYARNKEHEMYIQDVGVQDKLHFQGQTISLTGIIDGSI